MNIPKAIPLPHNDRSTHSGKPRKHMYTYMHTNTGCVMSCHYIIVLPELYFGFFQSLDLVFILSLVTVRKLPSQHQATQLAVMCVQ